MCLSALILAKVDTLFYGATLTEYNLTDIKITMDEVLSKSSQKLNVIKNFMEEECSQTLYRNKIVSQ